MYVISDRYLQFTTMHPTTLEAALVWANAAVDAKTAPVARSHLHILGRMAAMMLTNRDSRVGEGHAAVLRADTGLLENAVRTG